MFVFISSDSYHLKIMMSRTLSVYETKRHDLDTTISEVESYNPRKQESVLKISGKGEGIGE